MPLTRPTRLALALALTGAGNLALAEDLTSSLKINGFATAGVSIVTEDFGGEYLATPSTPGSGIDSDGSFKHSNVLGVQLTYQADENLDIVGQLISKGSENYDTRAEWAYLAYRVNDHLRLRAGRFANPLYLYSENVHVGQAYPWARLPAEVYALNVISNVDGVDALYRLPLGDWDLNLQAYQGHSGNSFQAFTTDARNQQGLNVTLGNGSFSLRASFNTGKIDITYRPDLDAPPPSIEDEKVMVSSLGMTFDNGSWFVAAEATQFHLDGYVVDSDAAFVSVGHYVGKWLPYVMLAKANAVNGDDCLAAFGGPAAAPVCRGQEREQTTYSAGFRYDLNKRASVKLQVEHTTDFNGTAGNFTLPLNGMGLPGTLSDDDSTEVITFNINAAF